MEIGIESDEFTSSQVGRGEVDRASPSDALGSWLEPLLKIPLLRPDAGAPYIFKSNFSEAFHRGTQFVGVKALQKIRICLRLTFLFWVAADFLGVSEAALP